MPATVHGFCPLIQVFDMPQSLAFYRDILEFEIVAQDRAGDDCDWVRLERGTAELMLNTAYESDERPAAPDAARIAAHADTMLYFNTPDVDRLYEELSQRGLVTLPPVVRPYGMRQLMLCDPDGYGLCFQWPANA